MKNTCKKKKLLFISKYVSVPRDLKVPRNFLLMRHLSEFGNDVHIICSDANHLTTPPSFKGLWHTEFYDELKVTWLKTIKYSRTNSYRRIFGWIQFELSLFLYFCVNFVRLKPDVIICSSLSLFTILNSLIFSVLARSKLVFEVRDIWPLTLVEEGNYPRSSMLIRILGYIERLGYKHSDLIVGTMPNLGAHVSSTLGYTKSTLCIGMGFGDFHIESRKKLDPCRSAEILDPNFFNILHLGSIGITNALESVLLLAETLSADKEIRFVIVGKGDKSDELKGLSRHLKNVVMFDAIPKSTVIPTLEQADILLFSTFPSRVWDYGQSLNKVVDYMLSGRPIVGIYSGFPSMINEAECGYLIEHKDITKVAKKIVDLKNMTPAQRSEIGARGKIWIEQNRSYRVLAEQYQTALQDL